MLDITPSKVFDAAEFDWKQAAVVVSISGKEKRQNAGKNGLIKLLDKRIRNAEKTMMNQLSTGVFSDGTGTSGKQVGGLQLLVADDPSTGTVGGINRASFSFWQNAKYDFSSASVTPSSSTIQAAMNDLWLNTVRGADHIDCFVAGSTYFNHFWQSLQSIQRITTADSGASGYNELEYFGPGGKSKVLYDDACAAARMYGLNMDYIHWRVHKDAWMEPMAEREPVNQDSVVVPVIFMGNLTMSNAELQGVIIA